MANKSTPKNSSQCNKSKTVPQEFLNKFIDAATLFNEMIAKGFVVIFSTGSLDPEFLTVRNHKNHGSIYVSINDMPEFFENSKFKTNPKLKKHYLDVQEFANTFISPHMQNNSQLSVEIMGIQNREFNKTELKSILIPHGAISANVNNITEFSKLDDLCELSIFEGYVVIDHSTGLRYKLKREYFLSKDNITRQRGAHKTEPTNYTSEGLALCGGGKLGYDNAAVTMIMKNIQEQQKVVIAELNNGVELLVHPIADVIKKQTMFPFDGEKMMNFFETTGQGNTYRYTDKPYVPDIFDGRKLEFQLKFDGETGILHKDANGKIHLMIKFLVDVFEINNNGVKTYRFGWINN